MAEFLPRCRIIGNNNRHCSFPIITGAASVLNCQYIESSDTLVIVSACITVVIVAIIVAATVVAAAVVAAVIIVT